MAETGLYSALLDHIEHPFFCVPLISYIEAQCIFFNPDVEDSKDYRRIHEEYVQLATQLLDSFREDLKLSHAEVIKSLSALQQSKSAENNAAAIERVLAIEDYPLFVRLMQRTNVELQQQALTLISVLNDSKLRVNATYDDDDDDDPVLALVLQISKEEFEEDCLKKSHKEDELKVAMKLSAEEAKKWAAVEKEDVARLDSEVKKLALAPMAITKEPEAPKSTTSAPQPLPREHPAPSRVIGGTPQLGGTKSNISNAEAASNWTSQAMAEAKASTSNATVNKMAKAFGAMSPEELERKQQFLREHRDKLVTMKKKEREQQLAAEEASFGRQRPVSARTARSAMTSQQPKPSNPDEEKKLAMRRAIAAKLKEEVIQK